MTIYEKNGKYYSRFKIHGEQKHFLCHGAKSTREAQAIEDAEKFKLRQQQAGLIKCESKLTLYKLLDKFLKYSEVNKKSYATDKCRVQLIKQDLSDREIRKIKPEDIEQFKEGLINKISPTTINKYLALLSKAFNIAVDNKYIEFNPCSRVKYFKKKNVTTRYLTEDEEKRLFKHLSEYMADIVHTALYTGLRKANILGLQWKQIDFNLKRLEVLENKGNKHIILPLTPPLEKILQRRYNERCCEYVFANPKTQNRYYEIDREWAKALAKAGIENFRFHDLRHTVGTRLAAKGVPINVIKEILAHSDIRTTMRYTHLTDNAKEKALMSIL